MTPDKQAWIVRQMSEDTALNQLRRIFSGEMGKIEQAYMQRVTPTGLELRAMEFAAVTRILIACKGIEITEN